MQEDSEAAKDREAKKEMIYYTGNPVPALQRQEKAGWESCGNREEKQSRPKLISAVSSMVRATAS